MWQTQTHSAQTHDDGIYRANIGLVSCGKNWCRSVQYFEIVENTKLRQIFPQNLQTDVVISGVTGPKHVYHIFVQCMEGSLRLLMRWSGLRTPKPFRNEWRWRYANCCLRNTISDICCFLQLAYWSVTKLLIAVLVLYPCTAAIPTITTIFSRENLKYLSEYQVL